MAGGRILGLDGLRAIAVSMVVVTHLGLVSGLNEAERLKTTFMPLIAGYTGVHIFFVLSGFLITLLLVREHRENGGVSIPDFFVRRVLRIFPVYFLVVGLTVALELMGRHVLQLESLPFLLTYTYNFVPEVWYSKTVGHTWSLAVEEHFYLVWPFLFLYLASRAARRLPLVTAAIFLLSIAIWLVLRSIEVLDDNFLVARWSFVAGGFIALGATAALLLEWSPRRNHWREIFAHPAALAAGLALFFHTLLVDSGDYGGQVRAVGIALAIGWIYLNQTSALTTVLDLPPLRYLGRISYGIYMWQGFFLATGPGRLESQTWPPGVWTGFALLVLVAPLSYHVFEKPILRLKNRFRPGQSRHSRQGQSQQAATF